MCLVIGSDWLYSRTESLSNLDLCVFDDMCVEEQWHKIFADTIQPYHKLEKLILHFDWPGISTVWRWSAKQITRGKDQDTLLKWREELLNFLHDHLRGIRVNKLNCSDRTSSITDRQLTGISMAITRNRSTAISRNPKQKLTLEDALLNVRLGRRQDHEELPY